MTTELLRVEGLCRNFGGLAALRNVSFSVGRGEQYSINIFHLVFEHLNAEIGAAVNNNIRIATSEHD